MRSLQKTGLVIMIKPFFLYLECYWLYGWDWLWINAKTYFWNFWYINV